MKFLADKNKGDNSLLQCGTRTVCNKDRYSLVEFYESLKYNIFFVEIIKIVIEVSNSLFLVFSAY